MGNVQKISAGRQQWRRHSSEKSIHARRHAPHVCMRTHRESEGSADASAACSVEQWRSSQKDVLWPETLGSGSAVCVSVLLLFTPFVLTRMQANSTAGPDRIAVVRISTWSTPNMLALSLYTQICFVECPHA
jgi:hypothetical protein